MGTYPDDPLKNAPLLLSIPRSNPFTVPPGYFESAESSILAETTAPSSLARETPFRVPEGYFDRFPSLVRENLTRRKRSMPHLLRPAFALAVAAAFTGILLLTKPVSRTVPGEQPALSYEELDASGYLGDVDETALIEALEAGDVKAAAGNDADIENYLIDNHVELDQITNEL